MTGTQASVHALALAWCILPSAWAAEAQHLPGGDTSSTARYFDIPRQPLAAALKIYGGMTGFAVMVQSQLAQRATASLKGLYTPDEALRRMLDGTGLQARRADAHSITVTQQPGSTSPVPPSPAPAAPIANAVSGGVDNRDYLGLVQARLNQALCGNEQTHPGSYRLAVQFWIGPLGDVRRQQLLSSTGDAVRDAAVAQVLQKLVIDRSPPPSMPQPVTILLRPDAPDLPVDCRPLLAGKG